MTIEEALERLRAADPAPEVEAIWEGPPTAADEVSRRRPAVAWLAAAAAVLLVAGIAVALAVGRRSDSHDRTKTPVLGSGEPPSQAAPSGQLIAPGAPDPNPVRTQAFLAELLARTPSLPHALPVPRAPIPALRRSYSSSGGSSHEIRLTRWFTAPGSVATASMYFSAHPAPGTTSGSTTSGGNIVTLIFDGGSRVGVASGRVTVEVDLTAYLGGVAVRVDVYAFWLPSRTTDSIIGVPASAVATVTVTGQPYRKIPAPRPVNRRLPVATAARLARLIDNLPGGVEVVHHCPPSTISVNETLRFSTPRGTYLVRPTNSPCGETTELRTPAGRVYPLGIGTLFADVLSALGLPQDFGSR